jgi:protein-tyrosine phosphatase
MSDPRTIRLDAVHNFRDYGRYPVAGGGRLKGGLLWRSAQHADATPADLDRIGALGLAAVIDLRGNKERSFHPCRRPEGFAAEVLYHDGETAGMPPHLQAELGRLDADGMRKATAAVYRKLPARRELLSIFARYFEALEKYDGPSLVHCFAGKDRTGIAVALFHKALGVHDDDIMEDYLLTNTAGDAEARIAAGAASVRQRYGEMSDEAVRTIMGVAPEYLENALDAIALEHGSVDSFLTNVLGVDDARRSRLRERYVTA